jgi:16S rRNA (guanine527-N7)-methyltransferase
LLAGAPGGEDAATAKLRTYALELLQWNRGVSNLISRNDEARLVERHLAESLAPATALREAGCERLLDLGSGAGLPAIPLAIAGVGAHWELVESRRNKTLFMRKALQVLEMSEVDVSCSRLETLLEERGAELGFDGFTSRATMTVGPTLEMAAQAVRSGGHAFLWKGSSFEQEMRDAAESWRVAWAFDRAIPLLGGPNVVAVFNRI